MFIGFIGVLNPRGKEGAKKGADLYRRRAEDISGSAWWSSQIVIVLIYFKRSDWEHCYVFFILSYSIGCFLTGRLLRFAPLVWGAFACWAIAILMTYTDTPTNMLLTSAAVLVSYIVPGYLLRAKYKHQLLKK